MNKNLIAFFLISIALFYSSCQDPSTIGSGLLDDEKLDVEVQSNFEIEGQTIAGKPVVTLIQNFSNYTSYPIGSYQDETYGFVESELFTRIVFNNTIGLPVTMHKAKFDSIVMIISYDTLSMYGDTKEVHGLTVREIVDVPVLKDSVFSNTPINKSNSVVVGRRNLVPNPKDSITILNYLVDTISPVTGPAQIRIPLDTNWFKQKFENIKSIETNIALQEQMKGFNISSDSKNSLLGMNFGAIADDANNGVNGIYVHYRDSANVKRVYRFLFSPYKFSSFASIPSPSLESKLNSKQEGESLLFVQGLDGVNTELTFNDISKLQGKIISYASLELTVADISGLNNILYPYIPQLSIVYDSDQGPILIRDLSDLLASGLPLNLGFGGSLTEKSGTLGSYKMNITKLIKGMVLGNIPNKIRIIVNNTNQRPHRTAFYGVKHPVYPVKLVVSYTNPPE
jgi:hypothetical protein